MILVFILYYWNIVFFNIFVKCLWKWNWKKELFVLEDKLFNKYFIGIIILNFIVYMVYYLFIVIIVFIVIKELGVSIS